MVSPVDDELGRSLSAVMDGEATPADWARVQAAWSADAGLRARWATWHGVADGLRAPELPVSHRSPEALLAALHAQWPAVPAAPRRRDWLPAFAVAASFVALSVGVAWLQPVPAGDALVATAPISTPRAQGLNGLSFAQTAAGRTLAGDAPPDVIDWGLALPEPAASQSRP